MSGGRAEQIQPSDAPRAGVMGRLTEILRRDAGRLFTTGVPHLFAALALTQGISMIRRILLARILTVGELGQMTYVMQIADFIAIVADFGISTAVLKYAAEPVAEDRKRQIYFTGLLGGSATASLVGLLYMAAVLLFSFHDDRAVQVFMLMVVPYIPLAAAVKIPLVFMQARKEIRRSARLTAITQVISLVMLVGATWLFGLWGFFTTVIVAPISNLIILLLATRSHLQRFPVSIDLLKTLTSFGVFSMLTNAVGVANQATSIVLLRHLLGSDETVGLYAVALMTMTGLRLLPNSLMQTAFPYLSGLINDPERLRARMRELAMKQVVVISAPLVAWYFLGPYVIPLVFGARYSDSFRPSMVLMLLLLPYTIGVPSAHALLVMGRVGTNLCAGSILLVVDIVACLLLIPRFGILGAAMAAAVAQIASTCFSITAAARVLVGRRPGRNP